ncbi:MAG: AAA family ATPase, partial [Alphaproteobacteria bacterium]
MGAAQNITRHFGGDWHGSQGAIPAPGHSKADRSVTVKDADNGDVVFHSFTDADWKDLKDECRRVGLLPEFEPTGAAWRETGVYQYRGYRTVRLEKAGEKKRFVAQRPDGKGGWINGLGDIPRVLYRADEVEAADISAPVYLVEGERKADKLASWGLIGTAVAFGAKGWKRYYADALASRMVVILPDNDDEGRGFAERAKADIESAGGKAVIVELPDLPVKGDIIDWKGTAEDLQALTFAAITAPPTDPLPSFDLLQWAAAPTPERHWTLKDWVPDNQATLFTGKGSAGKSLLAQLLCTCIAAGVPFLGIEAVSGPTIYVTCEDGGTEMHIRQKAICAGLGVSLASLAGKLHLISLFGELGNELATFDSDGRLSTTARYNQLVAKARAVKPRLIVIDNSAHVFGGNENDRHQVAAFIGLLNRLALEIGCAVILIAHPNKMGDSYSGSTSWENQVRSRIFMETPESEDGPLDPDARVIRREKSNYARNGEEIGFIWHAGTFMLPTDLPPNVAALNALNVQDATENARFLECLAVRIEQKRPVSESTRAGASYAPKAFAAMAEARGMKAAQFARAMERLFTIRKIERGELPFDKPGSRGHKAEGLRLSQSQVIENIAPQSAPSTSEKVRLSGSQVIDNACASVRLAHTDIGKPIPGAAHGSAAPYSDRGQPLDFPADLTRPIDDLTDDEFDPFDHPSA